MSIKQEMSSDIKLDPAQEILINKLEDIKQDIARMWVFRHFNPPKYKGLYLYGPVGRGKTLLAESFVKSLNLKKKVAIFHYQYFIKDLHERSHYILNQNLAFPVSMIADDLARRYRVIFIDELEIKDVTEALFMERLGAKLDELGVFVIFTSNTKPSNLYKGGIQREQMLKFIKLIEEKYYVYRLDHNRDYRFSKICSDRNTILIGNTKINREKFDDMLSALTHNKHYQKQEITSFGITHLFDKTFETVLHVNVKEILSEHFAKNEYIEICKKFEAIVIDCSNFIIEDSNTVIKFINLIDNIYTHNLLLVAIFDQEIENLYNDDKYIKEYQRAISRIRAMSSADYITNSKYYISHEEK